MHIGISKAFISKHDYLTFCFHPSLHVQNTVIKLKVSIIQVNAVLERASMVSELLSQGKANESGERGWGKEQGIIHILTMSSFPSSSTTKSSLVLNLTSL